MKWFRRAEKTVVAELVEEPGNEVVPLLNADRAQSIPSSVVVMSADGVRWAKLWGAQPVYADRVGNTIFNTNLILFGPMRQGMPPYLSHFTILNRQGEPLFPWNRLVHPITMIPGDTFQFSPYSLTINITAYPPGEGPTRAMQDAILDFETKEIGR